MWPKFSRLAWFRLLKKRPALFLLLGLLLATGPFAGQSLSNPPPEAPLALAFDFDNTLIHGNFNIYIYRGNDEFRVSTRDYAEIRQYVGKAIPLPEELRNLLEPELEEKLAEYADLHDFQFNIQDPTKSLRELIDQPGRNIFLERLEITLRDRSEGDWQGPRWRKFRDALLEEERADRVFIISSRSGDRGFFREGLEWLVELSYLRRLPPLENFYLVGGQHFPELGSSTEERKFGALSLILDRLETEAQARGVKGKAYFGDDDFYNYERVVRGVSENIARWSHVEIEIEYVGYVHPRRPFENIWFNRN